MKGDGDGDGWYLRVTRELQGEGLSSLGGLLLVGSVTYMQYNTHGLYFMKRNNALIRV